MSKRTKKDKRPVAKIDFKPYGAAIKAGRTKQKESRNKAADALFISPRYLANIENKGQHPSVQVFLELMSRYHISVDQILHGEAMEGKSTEPYSMPLRYFFAFLPLTYTASRTKTAPRMPTQISSA